VLRDRGLTHDARCLLKSGSAALIHTTVTHGCHSVMAAIRPPVCIDRPITPARTHVIHRCDSQAVPESSRPAACCQRGECWVEGTIYRRPGFHSDNGWYHKCRPHVDAALCNIPGNDAAKDHETRQRRSCCEWKFWLRGCIQSHADLQPIE
jgi:hypothetical protein